MSVRKLRKPLLISRPFLGAIDGFTIGLILGLWTDFLWLAKKIVIFDESMSYNVCKTIFDIFIYVVYIV